MLTIGWFSTGKDEAARHLLQVVYEKIQSGEIKGSIVFVFSNSESGEAKESDLFFNVVRGYHIPLVCLSLKRFEATQEVTASPKEGTLPEWRLGYDREVMRRLQGFTVDLCVLAGYMLIVGKEMCYKYDMINLHPATPNGPKGNWQQVIWTLMENKARESGVMMHLVTPELDRGPVITYCTYPIRGEPFDEYWQQISRRSITEIRKEEGENNPLFQIIRQHGLAREFPLIVSTLRAFSQGKVKIKNGVLFDSQGRPIHGYDLSDKVDRMIRLK